jgi:hypothetical protein
LHGYVALPASLPASLCGRSQQAWRSFDFPAVLNKTQQCRQRVCAPPACAPPQIEWQELSMDTSQHNMHNLFEQLGLPSNERDVEQFIRTHRLFSQDIRLDQATFWTPAQADFLREAFDEDSDWCEVVDDLNSRLRS